MEGKSHVTREEVLLTLLMLLAAFALVVCQ